MKKEKHYSTNVHHVNKDVRYRINAYDDRTIKGELTLETRNKKFVDAMEKFLIDNLIEYDLRITTTDETRITHE